MDVPKYFKFIERQNYYRNGVLIVTVPLEGFGALAIDEGDKYIFINSKLPKAKRTELINEGLKRHKEGFGQKILYAE
jgi:hypothetical protein